MCISTEVKKIDIIVALVTIVNYYYSFMIPTLNTFNTLSIFSIGTIGHHSYRNSPVPLEYLPPQNFVIHYVFLWGESESFGTESASRPTAQLPDDR
jgi:hypothetical protein